MKELLNIKKQIDYKKTTLNDRKQVIENALDTEFFENYFDENYQSNIKKNNPLAEENPVCKTLDQMASYLLASDEIKQQSKDEKQEYKFYSDPLAFKKALNKETSLEKLSSTENDENNENTLHILKQNEKNVKIVSNVKTTADDLNREDELSTVLNDYQGYIDVLDEKIKNGTENRFITTKIKGSVKDDMNIAKEHITGMFGELINTSESTKYDVSLFDLSNTTHLKGLRFTDSKGKGHNAKGLLYLKPTNDLTNDFNLLLIELQDNVKRANLNDLERVVASLLIEDISNTEIARKLGITIGKLRSTINVIARKVAQMTK